MLLRVHLKKIQHLYSTVACHIRWSKTPGTYTLILCLTSCQARLFRRVRIQSAIHIKPPITMRSVPFLTDSWVITGTDPETIPLIARALAEVARAYDCPRLSTRMTSVTIYFKMLYSTIKLLSSLSEPIYPDVQLNANKAQWISVPEFSSKNYSSFFLAGALCYT